MIYLALFYVYGFLGWLLEVIFHLFKSHKFINRGFLKGPICPIYGVGMVALVWFLSPFIDNVVILFVLAVILTSLLEYMTGYLLEVIFQNKWWDYSQMPLNVKGYICLPFSLIWGVLGVILVKFVNPHVTSLVMMFENHLNIIVISISILFIIDIILTIIQVTNFNADIKKYVQLFKESTLKEREIDLLNKFKRGYRRIINSFPRLENKKYRGIIKTIKEKISKML